MEKKSFLKSKTLWSLAAGAVALWLPNAGINIDPATQHISVSAALLLAAIFRIIGKKSLK